MLDGLEHLTNDYELAQYLQDMLVDYATGGDGNDEHYQRLRKYFLGKPYAKKLVPDWIRKYRDLNQFWQFIKLEFGTYAERRMFLWDEFRPLLEHLETKIHPEEDAITSQLSVLNPDAAYSEWEIALERTEHDPDGAITLARTFLESVCKSILDDLNVEYKDSESLGKLYRLTARQLNLAPDQHNEQVFKQILSGCVSVANGLGELRNKFGDAHGKGKRRFKPGSRHAKLAVNLAGTMALFLVETYQAKQSQ